MKIKPLIVRIVFLICESVIISIPAMASGDFYLPEQRINTGISAGTYTDFEHHLTSIPDGHVYAMWLDTRNGGVDLFFNSSSDYGVTWGMTDTRIDTGDAPGASSVGSASMCAIPDGHIYAVWNDSREGISSIYFNVSSDYGQTWLSNSIRISNGFDEAWGQSIDCNGSNVYVTYLYVIAGIEDIYFNASSDNGSTWYPSDVRLDTNYLPGDSFSRPSDICSLEDGRVYVFWNELGFGFSDMLVNVSWDYGQTWLLSQYKFNTGNTATDDRPQLSCDATGHVYALWEDFQYGKTDVYFKHSSNFGWSWSATVRIDQGDAAGSTASEDSFMASLSDGHVFVVWRDQRYGSNYALLFNRSIDFGATWLANPVVINPSPGSFTVGGHAIAVINNTVFIVWNDTSVGTGSGWLKVSQDYGITWLPTIFSPVNAGDPATFNSGDFRISANNGRLYLLWRDNRNNPSVWDPYHNVWSDNDSSIPMISPSIFLLLSVILFLLFMHWNNKLAQKIEGKGSQE